VINLEVWDERKAVRRWQGLLNHDCGEAAISAVPSVLLRCSRTETSGTADRLRSRAIPGEINGKSGVRAL